MIIVPKALEEKLRGILKEFFNKKDFSRKTVQKYVKHLIILQEESYNLVKSYMDDLRKPRDNKERLKFANNYIYPFGTNGEYIILTKDLLPLFRRQISATFINDIPIFTQLKTVPVFWINTGIVTLWNFYSSSKELMAIFKEVAEFSDKMAIFKEVEYTYLNFIETNHPPLKTIQLSSLNQSNPKLFNLIRKYITKNFWIIPNSDVKEVNPLLTLIFKDNLSIPIPCTPQRIVFRIEEIGKKSKIPFLGKEEYIEVTITYLTVGGNIKKDKIYIPLRLEKLLESGKFYNGLIISFIDLENEWIYPLLFSFYEEEIESYEIFQEILLLFFKKKYLESNRLFSIEFDESEFWTEVNKILAKWFKRDQIEHNIFSGLGKKNVLDLVFSESGLYPLLLNFNGKIFFVPPYISLLYLDRNNLSKFMTFYEEELSKESSKLLSIIKELSDIPIFSKDQLNTEIRQKTVFLKYLKELSTKLMLLQKHLI